MPKNRNTADALDAQIAQHLDGQLNDTDFASLNDRLADEPDAIDRLLASSACHAALAERSEHRAVETVIDHARVDHAARMRRMRRMRVGSIAAAALAAGLAIAATLWFAQPPATPTESDLPSQPPTIAVDDDSDGITDSVPPDAPRIDLTREIFASNPDKPAALAEPVPIADAPFLAVLTTAPVEAHLPVNWPILGGTLESFPRRPASVSPIDGLNPTLRFTP